MVETKVKAGTAASALAGLALWALGRYVFKGSPVPDVVVSWVYVIVPGLITFAAGYLARHTARPAAAPADPAARGGYVAGGSAVSDLPPPPASATQAPPTSGTGA